MTNNVASKDHIKPVISEISSFRDPGSQVYKIDGVIYRQINSSGFEDYTSLMDSGLYEHLLKKKFLVPHDEVSFDFSFNKEAKVVIQPQHINFISYPYEWCFSQFKDAALLTLNVMKVALKYNMILKDASSYNVQFFRSRPIFIDTGSFETYKKDSPWNAYGQFCRHFLAPLLLMAKVDINLHSLMKQYIDGIPLNLASKMLPKFTWTSLHILTNLHWHAKMQKKYDSANDVFNKKVRKISKIQLLGMIDSLYSVIKTLKPAIKKSEWGDYYNHTNYSNEATSAKSQIIHQMVEKINAKQIWDLGGNNGFYSRIASKTGNNVICFDIDPIAVEANYKIEQNEKSGKILPLLLDLTNPSYSLGWGQNERLGLKERGPCDLVMALALIHHLAISNNTPLNKIAEYFSSLGKYLIIEFIPKEDSQTTRLLSTRQDIFPDYNIDNFKQKFSNYYVILEEHQVTDTKRTLFLMKSKT